MEILKKELEKKGSDEETELALHHQLQNWFESQTKWKSYAEIGRATKIHATDVSKYFRGVKILGKKVCQKLSTVIDIEVLRQEVEKKGEEEGQEI